MLFRTEVRVECIIIKVPDYINRGKGIAKYVDLKQFLKLLPIALIYREVCNQDRFET